jgi:hypothetical protein
MTLITDNRELINEWTVESIYGFLKSPEWLEAFCKRHPEHILSDEDEIRDILEEDNRLWSVEYIQERNYDYFLIREWEKVE